MSATTAYRPKRSRGFIGGLFNIAWKAALAAVVVAALAPIAGFALLIWTAVHSRKPRQLADGTKTYARHHEVVAAKGGSLFIKGSLAAMVGMGVPTALRTHVNHPDLSPYQASKTFFDAISSPMSNASKNLFSGYDVTKACDDLASAGSQNSGGGTGRALLDAASCLGQNYVVFLGAAGGYLTSNIKNVVQAGGEIIASGTGRNLYQAAGVEMSRRTGPWGDPFIPGGPERGLNELSRLMKLEVNEYNVNLRGMQPTAPSPNAPSPN